MSNQVDINNKRIAKNTVFLYFRMIFTMVVSLYTSRVVLNALGVEDYGIYNVVGGIVTMFSVLSGSLTAAISRFLTFELGRNDLDRLKRVFSSALTIQIVLSILVFILAETIGLWFLNYKMIIPIERINAAHWVYQFSILTFAINLISVPYNATIIAHEKMSAFAYISILEVIGKLIVAFTIAISPIDKLIYYGLLLMLIAIIIRLVYGYYCKKHFNECSYQLIFDKTLLNQMFSFAGWNFWGSSSLLLMNEGVNILMNLFFGVRINAARGIATQVNNAVLQFVNNFTTAINPQIIKSYASNDTKYMFDLMYNSARYSYFLFLFFAVPLLLETNFILSIWLNNVPEYATLFVKLVIIISLISVLSNSMITAMLATGNIKKYQLIVGGLGMLVFPLSYILFLLGYPPETAYWINLLIFLLQFVARLFLMREMIGMKITDFLSSVLLKSLFVSIPVFIIPSIFLFTCEESIKRFFILTSFSIVITICSIWFVGINHSERKIVKEKLLFNIFKIKK